MLNKITNYQLLITNKLKKTVLATAVIMCSLCAVHAEEAQNTPAPVPEKYSFKLYVLAKGTMKKNKPRPDFGWRVLKAFPLKVREFTYPSPYMDSGAPEFKAAADNILSSIDEQRRKNAVRVADTVFTYVDETIAARDVMEEISETPHKVYYSALQAQKAEAGNSLEKCRLATAMLRYFLIPARIVSREGGYEVEYYIQPLSEQGKGAWYLYGFGGNGPGVDEYFVPVAWHPVDAKELLNEEWESPMFIKLMEQKKTYINGDDEKALADFEAYTGTDKSIEQGKKPPKGIFYVIDEFAYELWLNPGARDAKAEFTLAFNIPDDFKTMKYFIKSDDKRLTVRAKWPQTKTKPSQEGIIYTLPVIFSANNNQ